MFTFAHIIGFLFIKWECACGYLDSIGYGLWLVQKAFWTSHAYRDFDLRSGMVARCGSGSCIIEKCVAR